MDNKYMIRGIVVEESLKLIEDPELEITWRTRTRVVTNPETGYSLVQVAFLDDGTHATTYLKDGREVMHGNGRGELSIDELLTQLEEAPKFVKAITDHIDEISEEDDDEGSF